MKDNLFLYLIKLVET